ncbi:hypothetical protein LOC67_23360 [Stieleria sp. JC731]|uniref:hypothetical protein n=1 Tax=Pirellulaceae TaxID=2691357 RepID=UPI001E5C189A|nr:hypothetical protein [Stieleria sp. JC731]MCC9603498.1 hypothetical protein [Stieleria sp. JC731]
MTDKNVVVTINGKHDGIIKSFDAAEAAARKYAAANGVAAKDIDAEVSRIAGSVKSFIKGAADGFSFYGRQLRSIKGEGKDMHDAMEKYLRDNGLAGKQSADDIIAHYKKVNPELAKVLENARAQWKKNEEEIANSKGLKEQKDRVRELVGELKGIEGVFGGWGTEIDEALNQPLGDARVRANQIVNELMDIDPERARQLQEAIERAEAASGRTEFDKWEKQLAAAGTQGDLLVRMFRDDMRSAEIEAGGGIDQLMAKISAMEPRFAGVAQEWRRTWNIAADKVHEELGESINVLRMAGPEGEKAADAIVDAMQRAGRLSASAIDKIFAPLDPSNTALSGAMTDIRNTVEKNTNETNTLMQQMSDNAVRHIGGAMATYIGIDQAIQGVTNTLREQQELLDGMKNKHISVGEAQSAAASNFAGLNAADRKSLQETIPFEMQRKYDLSEIGLSSTILAGGVGISAGGTVDQVKSAIDVATRMNLFKQDQIDETTSGLVSIGQNLGLKGEGFAEKSANFLLNVKRMSRIEDDEQLVKDFPALLASASVNAGKGKGAQSAIEAASAFTLVSQLVNDKRGEATVTNLVNLDSKMAEFFTGMRDGESSVDEKIRNLNKTIQDQTIAKRESAMSGLADLDRIIASQTEKAVERARQRGRGETVDGPVITEAQKIRREKLVAELESLKGGAYVTDAQRRHMDSLRQEKQSYYINGRRIADMDPETFSGRQSVIAQNGLYKRMLQTVGPFAEQKYRKVFEQMLTDPSSMVDPETRMTLGQRRQGLLHAAQSQDDLSTFLDSITKNATPQQRAGLQQNAINAVKDRRDATSSQEAYLAQNRELYNQYITETRGQGMTGILNKLDDVVTGRSFRASIMGDKQGNLLSEGIHMQKWMYARSNEKWNRTDNDSLTTEQLNRKQYEIDTIRTYGKNLVSQIESGVYQADELADASRWAKKPKFTTAEYREKYGANTEVTQAQIDVLHAIHEAIKEQREILTRTADASEDTANNTDKPKVNPLSGRPMNDAYGNR